MDNLVVKPGGSPPGPPLTPSDDNRKDIQSEAWEFILYLDSEGYDFHELKNRICQFFESDGDQWAYCLHDKDTDENGELKKPHIHLMCHSSKRHRLSQMKRLAPEVGSNIERCRKSWRSMIRYLAHEDETDPHKFHYSIETIESNFPIGRYFNTDVSQQKRMALIYDYIIASNCRSYRQLVRFGIENNCVSEVRRGWTMWKDFMKEP